MSDEATRVWFSERVHALQDEICDHLREVDPGFRVREDLYERADHRGEPGGGGRTRAVSGDVFEGGGVNVSEVHGALDPGFVRDLGGQEDDRLWAAGISLILHPRNPRVPTVHMNFRMLSLGDRIWFGGGADLTPYFPYEEDFSSFHRVWRDATAPLGTWRAWKERCDAYFVNAHRGGEMRGVGGIFFDHWRRGTVDEDARSVVALSRAFLPSYLPIVRRRMNEPYTAEDEVFMLHRRGRYVEFNLLHDRGTVFGLRSGGRTESILVSLPPRVRFAYDWSPEPGSPHAVMMGYYRPQDWVPEAETPSAG